MKSRLSNKILETHEIHYGHDVEGTGQDLTHQNLIRDQSTQRWPEIYTSNALAHYRAWWSIIGIVQQRHSRFLHDLKKIDIFSMDDSRIRFKFIKFLITSDGSIRGNHERRRPGIISSKVKIGKPSHHAPICSL